MQIKGIRDDFFEDGCSLVDSSSESSSDSSFSKGAGEGVG